MFKVSNKDITTTPMAPCSPPCSSVSIVDLEQVNIGWEGCPYLLCWKKGKIKNRMPSEQPEKTKGLSENIQFSQESFVFSLSSVYNSHE